MQLFSFEEAIRRGAIELEDAPLVTALEILWRADRYAADAGVDIWDFAVEIEEFRRAQISHSELRWLLTRGFAQHAAEIAASGGRRKFRQLALTSLGETSCFVIADPGRALVESWNVMATKSGAQSSATLPMRPLDESAGNGSSSKAEEAPLWEVRQRKLWVAGNLVKQFHCPAPSQQLILNAFQESHWSAHVVDPLPLLPEQCPKRRLHDAIKRLNRGHLYEAIRFSGDGSGRGVLWKRLC